MTRLLALLLLFSACTGASEATIDASPTTELDDDVLPDLLDAPLADASAAEAKGSPEGDVALDPNDGDADADASPDEVLESDFGEPGGDGDADDTADTGGTDSVDATQDGGDGGTDCAPAPYPDWVVLSLELGEEAQGGPEAPGGWLANPFLEPRILRYRVVPSGFDAALTILRPGDCIGMEQYFDGGGPGEVEDHEVLTFASGTLVGVSAVGGGVVGPFTIRVADECTRTCGERVCGPDGCGGSCGECDNGDACATTGQCAAWLPYCSPAVSVSCGSNLLPALAPDTASLASASLPACPSSGDTGLTAPEMTARFVAPFDGAFTVAPKSPYNAKSRVYRGSTQCADEACLAAASYGGWLTPTVVAMKAGDAFDVVLDSPAADPQPWWYGNTTGNLPKLDVTCCQASCAGAACGPNGCGGTCGGCGDTEACVQGACVAAPATCEPIGTLSCDQTVTGTFAPPGAPDVFSTHGCHDGTFPGTERVYRFSVTGKTPGAWLSAAGASVFAYEGATACSTAAMCIGYGTAVDANGNGASSPFSPVAGKEYFLVVDATAVNAGQAFSFTVDCQ